MTTSIGQRSRSLRIGTKTNVRRGLMWTTSASGPSPCRITVFQLVVLFNLNRGVIISSQKKQPGKLHNRASDKAIERFRVQIELAQSNTMTEFHDLFVHKDVVDSYAKVRPTYPASLFEKLSSLTQQHERAWDVGCGSGQATISIAEHYQSVVGTDVSEPQVSHGIQRPNITYVTMSATPSAEELELVVGPEGSVDLVTVATAVHWFDLDKFYTIVKHLLRKPGGVFAVWTYHGRTVRVSPEFDIEFNRFQDKVNAYRTYTSEFTSQQYRNLPFPFEPVRGVQAGTAVEGNPEELKMEKLISFDDFLLLMKSGSPLQMALEQGVDLLNEDAIETLSKAWGPERVRNVIFPFFLLLGTVAAPPAE